MSKIVRGLLVLMVMCVLHATGNRIYGDGEVINNALYFKETNEASIDRSSQILVNRATQFKHQIVAKKNDCSRYCIRNDENKATMQSHVEHKKIHLMWYISQDSLDYQHEQTTVLSVNKFKESNYSESFPEKCAIQLSIDCKINRKSSTENENNYFDILRNNKLTEYSSNKFNINEDVHELQLKIMGNVTWIFLEMPAGKNRMEPLDLALERDNDSNEVNLVANNPPPGGWLLKLRGRENSTYSLIARQILSPGSIAPATNNENIIEGIGEEGIVIYLEDTESTPQSRQASLIFEEESSDKKNLPGNVVFQEPLDELSKLQIEENTDSELEELSRASNLITRGASLPVDLAQETSLLAKPGSIHTVAFVVSNNQLFEILHVFQARSTQLQIIAIDKRGQWLRPGESTTVRLNLLVPSADENAVNSVTLLVNRGQNLQPVEKSAYIYVESSNSAIADSTKPTIDFEFSNNCAGRLRLERCENSFWSVEITVTDDNSGLKTVTSRPGGIYPRREFIAGTKNAVNFIYTSTCCETTVDVTATDVAGNSYTRTIDVNAWDNLTTGEIAAIVVGSLFLLLIIVLLILLCIYCARRRKSADISYTQRYGSRTGPTSRTEGTNF